MTTLENTQIYQNEYQRRCEPARKEFASRKVVKEIFTEGVEPKLLKLFMIHWSALSAGLTEPIPAYLKRAGERCEEEGLKEMAEFFYQHEEEEEGHDNWATEDVKKLVDTWNLEEPKFHIDSKELLNHKMSPAVKRYHQLHERVIEGDSPCAELAIDVEIELISTTYGPLLLKSWVESMGQDSLPSISFLYEHVRADVGHTETNFQVVHKLLAQHPEYTDILVETAGDALNSYADFLDDAMNYAKKMYALVSKASV
ncbi:hypothetical protein H6G97_30415 [Nostoc flagelliforme FACHB-838]|uniref:Iron-containing redox enzyme family protein n=1 Tax=Nostoc flagelliforme FACHB-838 TaxID=2692904 RepID=A0ABR8DWN3_9NOSO|nr:hypothetical protein [Nostoc flagelliforme]MBD2533633.1 hypothetical protein [Nostoc flagelliforme FACHB-838]